MDNEINSIQPTQQSQQTIPAAPKQSKVLLIILAILALALATTTALAYFLQQNRINDLLTQNSDLQAQVIECPNVMYTSGKGDEVIVYTPNDSDTIASPLTVIGQIPGSWATEGDFVAVLKNSDGVQIAESVVTINGNWMTDDLVPFSTTIAYNDTGTGTLVLQKDNPSGLPVNDDQVAINVQLR